MYKVTCLYDGKTYTLHDPDVDVLKVYDDEVVTETNDPGSFTFSVSYNHPYLDKIVGLASDIRVYDDDEEIFRGRPIDDGEDLYRMRTFKCEGELAFLYDSIQPRRELHGVSPLEFFTLLIDEHNAQVKDKGGIDKTFKVGVVTVIDSNNSLYRYTNRETTLDDILDKLVDRLGGYLNVRVTNGVRYIDLLADVETVGDQPIQLGENLMDYAKDTDYTEVATACIPLGEALEETEIAALDAYLTVADANNGSDVIQLDEAVKKYGFICKVVSFDDYTTASTLLAAGKNWLTDGQYANMTLSLAAVDLHSLGYDFYSPIRINTQVRFVSELHGMDRYFETTKRTYHLTKPESDTVQFGTTEKQKSYTSSSHSKVTAATDHAEQVRKNIDSVIEKERANVSDILNQATHGYVVLDPNEGPERILIMDTNNTDTAQKIWKWDMNGLGYSSSGINGPWGVAITMNGQISADFILTGELDASLIKTGRIQDVNGKNYWDMETGEFSLAATTTVGGSSVIVDTDVEYYLSTSSSTQTGGSWLTKAPAWKQGYYLYTRTVTTFADGKKSYSDVSLLAGKDGIGVSSVEEQYYLSTSSTTQTGGSWSATQQTWVKGRYYWTRSKITWSSGAVTYSDPVYAKALTSGNQSTDDLDAELTQTEVFNRLTNNGKTQGIYMSGGLLYINATYIATGILKDTNGNTSFNLSTGVLTMNKGSINIGNGTFKVDSYGNLTASSATINGTIFSGDSGGYWIKTTSDGKLAGGYGSEQYGYLDYSANIYNYADGRNYHGIQVQGGILRIATSLIAVYKGTSTSPTSTNGGSGTMSYISSIVSNGNGSISWTGSSIQFINGIMVSQL